MGDRRVRRAARVLAAVGTAALVTASPGVAAAATQYDGDATALQVEGLRLELLPGAGEATPEQLEPLVAALDDLRAQAPEQLRGDSLTLGMPDQVIGHASFPGTDTQGEIPDNPLLTADVLEARSVRADGGRMLSEASVSGLSLGAGLLSADVIRTRCAGTGEQVTLDISQLRLNSNQDIVRDEVSLRPGTAVPIAGLGSITFNERDTDGTTYAEGTNVVIDLDSDLSLGALARLFGTTAPAVEDALRQVLVDLSQTEVGGQKPLEELGANADQLSGEALYQQLEQASEQVTGPLAQQAPQLDQALNDLAHLSGTVTVANAACSQAVVDRSVPQQSSPQPPAAQPVADTAQPPLADTGSPAGMAAMTVAGLGALAAGALTLMRLRRRGA